MTSTTRRSTPTGERATKWPHPQYSHYLHFISTKNNTSEHRSSITAKDAETAFIKSKFAHWDETHIFLFHGRRKIRYDSFKRLSRVALTYPFVLVFGLLNLDQTAFFKDHFKGWYSFCIMVNTLIYILPVIIVRFILYKNSR